MPLRRAAAALPVLLIYNVDPVWTSHERDEVTGETRRLGSAMEEQGHSVMLIPITTANLAAQLEPFHPDDHIVFNWCECLPGIPHSEAHVTETLESLNFVFTGADSRALALSQDKQRVKALLTTHSITTPRWAVYENAGADDWECFPAIVKPAHEHCSIGITSEAVVMSKHELQNRIDHILKTYRQPALVEDFIDGREFRVALWGDSRPRALPIVEMAFSAFPDLRERLCTYDSKFDPASLHYNRIETLLPAPLREAESRLLCKTAAAAYSVTGCRDYGRIDLRLRHGVFYVLDVNPNPDLSADASMAYAAEYAGFSYGALGSYLVALAACRHPLLSPHGVALAQALGI
jgi:D-alanine-D-alanine ligase